MRSRTVWWYVMDSPYGDDFAESLGAGRSEWIVGSNRRAFRPPFDVFETDQHLVIKVEIAGMREEDFSIALDGYVLRIGGSRGDSGGKLAYQRMEVNYGEFRLAIRLPHLVDQDEIDASYDRGFLSVYVPRQPQLRRIPVSKANED